MQECKSERHRLCMILLERCQSVIPSVRPSVSMGSRIGEEEDSAFVELFFDEQNKKKKKKRRRKKNKNTSLLSKWRPCHTERERERKREREILKGRKETRRSPRTRRAEGPRRGTDSNNNASTRRQTRKLLPGLLLLFPCLFPPPLLSDRFLRERERKFFWFEVD